MPVLAAILSSIRQMIIAGKRRKASNGRIELHFNRSCGPVALFADNHFCFAVHLIGFGQSFRELFAVRLQWLTHLVVVLFAVHEQDDVSVLLD